MRASDWISCKDAQPVVSGDYLALTEHGTVIELSYSFRHSAWNARDEEYEPDHALPVAYWMPIVLPEGLSDDE